MEETNIYFAINIFDRISRRTAEKSVPSISQRIEPYWMIRKASMARGKLREWSIGKLFSSGAFPRLRSTSFCKHEIAFLWTTKQAHQLIKIQFSLSCEKAMESVGTFFFLSLISHGKNLSFLITLPSTATGCSRNFFLLSRCFTRLKTKKQKSEA